MSDAGVAINSSLGVFAPWFGSICSIRSSIRLHKGGDAHKGATPQPNLMADAGASALSAKLANCVALDEAEK